MLWTLLSAALAAEITEDRRTYADQTVQERWTWLDEKSPESLLRKEWFHPDGERSRLEEYAGGELNGRLAVWDHQGVLQEEEHYRAGQLHGSKIRWAGAEGERWAEIELQYVDGVPHGEQLVRSDKDTVQRRHNYEAGQLHGPQQAWQAGGEMHYDLSFQEGLLHGEQRIWGYGELEPETWLHFDQGLPDGKQRLFVDQDWRDEVWTEGLWENVVQTHEDGQTPKRVEVYELDVRPMDREWHREEPGPPQPARELRFHADKRLVRKREHHENGVVSMRHEQTGDKHYQAWADNAQLVLEGHGDPVYRVGRWTEWRPDGSLYVEEDWAERRKGARRVYDPQERLREVETWNWELERWQVFVYQGEHQVAEGELHTVTRQRWGVWTYSWPDGEVRRIEEYGHGPYSGNRPYVHKSEEFRRDGSLWCSGDERDLSCTREREGGGHEELKVKALQRPRHGFESYDRESFSFQRREDLKAPELAEGALVVAVLDGRGLVVERAVHGTGGLEFTETYDREGALTSVQGRGWVESYREGRLSTVEEDFAGGERCELVLEDGQVARAVFYEADGTAVRLGESKAADRLVAACPVWERHPELRP
jgi:hypothetical protein